MQDIRKVLEHLLKHELFVKLEIYIFNSSKINFLGFVLTNKGAKMDLNQVSTIEKQLMLKVFCNIQVFEDLQTSIIDLLENSLGL